MMKKEKPVEMFSINRYNKGEIDDWIRFFNVKTEEDLEMIRTKNLGILEAMRILRRMSMSNPLRLYREYGIDGNF